ncbi:ABC-type polar amino acid transport system ATPase subunit [Aminobacter niigataensis]|uniref:ABC-type polar amino acid transport system ATPase subunit n=1 Tax=Aminobacter niigataensis TaxID=83265 RepID=A0ABR6L9D8_9HYPH|nr:ABC-type polar amino acid transport system ATPase subunit [Aminobacter niigataensis]
MRSATLQRRTKATPAVAEAAAVEMIGMNKWYGPFHVLKEINLTVRRGEKLVICGPSGSGKSTLIRCINRLEEHQQGHIVVDGTELTSDLKKIDEIRRDVGMVFQHFNLFLHLTVLENLTLGPIWVRRMRRHEAEQTAFHYLDRVRIPDQAHKSGTTVRRPATARSYCTITLHESQNHAVRRTNLGA